MSWSHGVISQRTGDGDCPAPQHQVTPDYFRAIQGRIRRGLFLRERGLFYDDISYDCRLKLIKWRRFFLEGDYFQAARCNCQPFKKTRFVLFWAAALWLRLPILTECACIYRPKRSWASVRLLPYYLLLCCSCWRFVGILSNRHEVLFWILCFAVCWNREALGKYALHSALMELKRH